MYCYKLFIKYTLQITTHVTTSDLYQQMSMITILSGHWSVVSRLLTFPLSSMNCNTTDPSSVRLNQVYQTHHHTITHHHTPHHHCSTSQHLQNIRYVPCADLAQPHPKDSRCGDAGITNPTLGIELTNPNKIPTSNIPY